MEITQVIALVLLSLFYSVYFIKMLILKKQNIKGNLLAKGNKPKDGFFIEIILRAVTFLCVPVQYGSVLWGTLLWSLPAFPTMREVGLILMLHGNAVFSLAVITMRNNWRAGYNYEQDTQLVTNGVYKTSRNPAFVGFNLLYIGCALAYPNFINIIFTLTAVAMFHVQILGEEKFLAEKFGDDYLAYKAKVRRYI